MEIGPLQSTPPFPGPLAWTGLVLAVLLLSVGVVVRIARPQGTWGRRLRGRFVLGVPWGTLLVVAGVLAVYLFVQDGVSDLSNPVVLPFMAWGYGYPLGMVTAGLAHASFSHLTGNLLGTLAFAPLAEYAWSHFPRRRGSQTGRRPLETPLVRVLVFALGTGVVAVLTSLFGWGPVVGFSGAVFAFVGFALVSYPLATVVALSANSVLRVLYRAVRQPVQTAEAGPQFITPSWAGIAIQGHAIGILFGIVLGGVLAAHRGSRPSPARLWVATVIVGVAQSLWAVYWFLGEGRYVLFRAVGVVLVVLLATLVTAALTASNRPRLPPLAVRSRNLATMFLLAVTLGLCLSAVPTNLIDVSSDPLDDGIEVEDYTVVYAEDVTDQYVSPFNVNVSNPQDPFEDPPDVETSGVIVVSEQRQTFHTVVPAQELAFEGETDVVVGGLGWRGTVTANRTTWQPVGNESVYRVSLSTDDGNQSITYASQFATAEPRLDGREVVLVADPGGFRLVVRRGDELLARTPIPGENETVTAGGLTFERTDDRLYGEVDDTRVRLAQRRG